MPFVAPQQPNYNLLFQGIMEGVDGITQGIRDYRAKEKEKEMQEKATDMFSKYLGANPEIAKSIGIADPADKKVIGVAIKSLGGPQKAMEFGANAMQLQEIQRKQAEQQALKARMDSMLQMSQNPQGPLSNANAARMQDPAIGAAMKAYQLSGDPKQATEIYGEQMKQYAANSGRGREGPMSSEGKLLADYNAAVAGGDKATAAALKAKIDQPPFKPFPDATEAGKITMAQKEAENDAKMNFDYITETVNAAKDSKNILSQNKKIIDLYRDGAKSGFGQDFMSKLGSLGVSMGFVKKEDQSKQEQLRSALAAGQLANAREFLKGQGSVTESERARVDAAGANFDNQDLANLNIVGTTMAIANHRVAKEKVRQQLYDKGLRGGNLAESLRRWDTENDFSQFYPQEVSQLMDQIQRQDALVKKGIPAAAGPRQK